MAKKNSAAIDLEQFIPTPSKSQLGELSALVNRAVGMAGEIAGLTELLKVVSAEYQRLTTDTLPQMMAAVGVSDFKTTDGAKVEVKDFLSGSLPKDPIQRDLAMEWLENNGAVDLIKFGLTVQLGKGEMPKADKVRALLVKAGVSFDEKLDVHAQTLQAFIRERMRSGDTAPLELLGLYAGKVAKISLPKTKL